MPKEHMYYTCIASIIINYVIKMEKKNYPQAYIEGVSTKLEKCKCQNF